MNNHLLTHDMLKSKISVFIMAATITLATTSRVTAIDHWWHGGISSDVNNPTNWTDRNPDTPPTTPTGDPRDIVRIGGAWGSEDINQNGVLDPGEDLNFNGEIDDPYPVNVVGYGGYYEYTDGTNVVVGGGVDLAGVPFGAANPVLSTTYISRTTNAEFASFGGWWFVLNYPNSLTIADGGFLIMNRDNNNIRNGGRILVSGRSETNGPSLITGRDFRMAENGSLAAASNEVCQLIINGTGWMQSTPYTRGGLNAALRIGDPTGEPGTRPKGEFIIEGNGRYEVLRDTDTNGVPAAYQMYFLFGQSNSIANQVILRDKGEIWMPGPTEEMASIGDPNNVVSLQTVIDLGLITTDQAGATLVVDDSNAPTNTIISVSGPSLPSLSWTPTATGIDVTFDGTLQEADEAAGPYSNVEGATSPYSVTADQPRKFYRASQ